MYTFYHFRKIEHPSNNNGGVNYDFALLKMKKGFNLPNIPNVAPACLPSRSSTPSNVDVRNYIVWLLV